MAVSKRHRYKSRRERLQQGIRRWKVGIIFFLVAASIFAFKERVAIWDWFQMYFI